MKLNGSYIWLVGASEGIGAALAHKLAQAGAHVAVSARSEDKILKLVQALPENGHRAIVMDVTDLASVAAAWEKLLHEWPRIDGIIYNAGVYEPMEAKDFNLASAEQMLDVNYRGATRVLSLALPYFIKSNAGHIALVGSVAGYRGLPAAIGYGASKAALIHLAQNLKADLSRSKITVQIINPGFVATRLTAKNSFAMPFIITPEKAADYIMQGIVSDKFEIHFPKRFSLMLKTLSLLPAPLYFWLITRLISL